MQSDSSVPAISSGAPMLSRSKPCCLEHLATPPSRGVAQVLVRERVDVVLGVAALPLARGVVVARQLLEQLGAVGQLTQLEHEHAGALLVGEQHAEALGSSSTASSWLTAGVWLITTRLCTGTGSAITCHRSWAAQANIASPRVRERSTPALHELLDAVRSRATDESPVRLARSHRAGARRARARSPGGAGSGGRRCRGNRS